ncbi:MAG: apolipoprotein N-acyltransferase, partial [Candidatus Margulisbacteria bacterium]|nr:apolipoprotein N-acyltransferase [Candidatus Margulisiibacteriota bacterium]
YNLFWLAWIALVPLFVALMLIRRWWQALICGLLTGLIYFGGVLHWLKIVGIWAGEGYGYLAWIALVVFQSIFIGFFTLNFYFLFKWIKIKVNNKYQEYLFFLLAPAGWIVVEWLRALGPFGVSTGALAYSQYQVLPLIQIVSLFGSYGLSFLIVLVNYVIARALLLTLWVDETTENNWPTILRQLGLVALIMGISLVYGFYTRNLYSKIDPQDRYLRVALFQPNVPQEKKLDSRYYNSIKDMYVEEAKRYFKIQKADLVIWPETIVPQLLLRDRYFVFRIKEAARLPILFGTPTLLGKNIYNSMVLINERGQELAIYHKQHLVPFGEYLPFKKLLYPFLAGTNYFQDDYSVPKVAQSFSTPWGKFACGICFESTLPQLIRMQVIQGGQLITIITNDAWFKQTAAMEEHLAMSLMRAVENRRYLIQVANTGYTFIVNPAGQIMYQTNLEKQEWLIADVFLKNKKSFYTKYGDVLVYLSLFFIIALGYQWIIYKRQESKKRKIEKLRKEYL